MAPAWMISVPVDEVICCPACGNRLPVGPSAFCDNCGAPLAAALFAGAGRSECAGPDEVASRILNLSPFWRERFLEFIAEEAGRDGAGVGEDEMRSILAENPALCDRVEVILDAWERSRKR
jgi:hypothetical protein